MNARKSSITPSPPIKKVGNALGITVLAFILSSIFIAPFIASTASFFSSPDRNDFTIVDMYNMIADDRAVSYLDTNIVVINIDNCGRPEIADILRIASLAGSKVVGLDVMFDDPREGDEDLLDAIRETKGLVMPLSMRPDSVPEFFHIDSQSYFYPAGNPDTLALGSEYASASMPSKYAESMIREMQVYFPTRAGDTILSVPVKIADMVNPEAYDKLRERGNTLEQISYHSRRFARLEPEEVMENADTLTNRIVLIGALHERGDIHPTPVDPVMPGVLIHAHSLATILDGAYMTTLPKWVNILIAFVICFFVVAVHVFVSNGAKALLLRFLQLGLLWVILQIGYWAFVSRNLIIDFSYALLMLAFGLFACDIWNGVVCIIEGLRKSHRERSNPDTSES